MANKNLRGITIEIGGDTTKLGKALEDSEKKSRSLSTELRQIEQSLKFNPTNVEILAQKQTVLTQNIAETSDKLDTLREAERQVIAQFERGEVAEEQVRALQREIIKTENQLENMGNELRTTNQLMSDLADGTHEAERRTEEYTERLDEATQELEDFKDQASGTFDAIKTGTVALGAGAVAGAGYALTLSTEFDKAFNIIQTQTGATAEEMEDLNEIMENIYSNNFGESIEDVAKSMATVKTQTKLSGDELQNATQRALLLRDTFEFEVNESTRSAKMLMDQYGISAEEAFNLIAQGAQNGLDKNGDLLDTINEYAVHFQQLGIDAETMFTMLSSGAESGTFSVDKLGDAVKEFGIRAKDGSDSSRLAFEYLGYDADKLFQVFNEGGQEASDMTRILMNELAEMPDGVEKTTAGVALFGTMWEDLGAKGINALAGWDSELDYTKNVLDDINDQKYDDIGSAIRGLGRTLQTDLVEPLGEELKPVVEDAIDYVKENGPAIKEVLSNIVTAVGNFVKMVIDNKDAIIATIVAIGAGMLAWNVANIIMTVVSAIKTFTLALQAGKTVMQALNLVMSANPIGLIIALIAGLVAGFIYLWNTSEEFRNFWIGLWEIIKNAVSVAVEAVVTFFSEAWTRITEVWAVAVEWFGGIANSIMSFFSLAWEGIVAVWSVVSEWFAGIWASIVEVFSPATEWFTALFTSIYDTLASIVQVIIVLIQGCWEIIKLVFSVVYDWFNTNVIQPVKNAFSVAWDFISSMASSAWETIKATWNIVSSWFNKTIITPISDYFSKMWGKLKSGASDAWTGIKNVFSSVTSWFKSKFTDAWTAVKGVFSTGGKIFSGITEGITSAFKKVVNAIIGGINRVVSVPFNAINGVLNTIRNVSIAKIQPFSGLPSISVPQIPLLYRGGILRKGQVGLLEGNGAEAVVPLEKETAWITRIAQKMNDLQNANPGVNQVALASKMDEMIQTMKALKSTIVLDTGVLVGETINQIDEQLGNNYSMRERRI